MEGAVREERGCLGGKYSIIGEPSFISLFITFFPHSPLQKHHRCLLLMRENLSLMPEEI